MLCHYAHPLATYSDGLGKSWMWKLLPWKRRSHLLYHRKLWWYVGEPSIATFLRSQIGSFQYHIEHSCYYLFLWFICRFTKISTTQWWVPQGCWNDPRGGLNGSTNQLKPVPSYNVPGVRVSLVYVYWCTGVLDHLLRCKHLTIVLPALN